MLSSDTEVTVMPVEIAAAFYEHEARVRDYNSIWTLLQFKKRWQAMHFAKEKFQDLVNEHYALKKAFGRMDIRAPTWYSRSKLPETPRIDFVSYAEQHPIFISIR